MPVGVHQATLDEVLTRFGHGTPQRQLVTTQLVRVYELARANWQIKRDQSKRGIIAVRLEEAQ